MRKVLFAAIFSKGNLLKSYLIVNQLSNNRSFLLNNSLNQSFY
jgi:hypothetical protein